MYKAAKGSLNTVFAEGDTADTEDEEDVVSDVKVITVTNENEDTNGLIVVEYDPEQLELVGSAGAVKYNAVYGGDAGKVRVGFINDEAIAAGTTIANLTFRVLDQASDAYVTVVTEEENEEHPQTKKEILVSENKAVAVTDVTLSESDIILTEGKTAALTATVTPEEATNKEVRWISTSPAVATVAQDGTVTAVASGTTFILVSTVDGGHTAICKVTVDDKIQSFVRRLYTLCFSRNPDAGGFNSWTTKLRNKTITAAEAVRGFFLSKEMNNLNLSNEDFVERCYLVMMDRPSDAGGKKYWVDKMKNGVPKLDILQGFVVSKEFTKICADFGIERGSLK